MSTWNDELWLKNFRMKKSTFRFLYDQLGACIRRENTRMRDAIPPEKRLAAVCGTWPQEKIFARCPGDLTLVNRLPVLLSMR